MPKKTKDLTEKPEKKETKKVTSKINSKNEKTKKVEKKSSSKTGKKIEKTKVITKKETTTKEKKSTTKKIKPQIVEYYDLPLNYNKTVVKILYQTPKTLFVYWEISNDDAQKYKKIYGDNFFETTKPVLIVHNDTLGYSFEIDINDFANSWYFNINDSDSIYRAELGRRPIPYKNTIKSQYIYISSSNIIKSPNDTILFEKYIPETIIFKNIKTNQKRFVSLKEIIHDTTFATKLSNLYKIKIKDLYKAIYKNNTTSDLYKLLNPSSNNSSF